ncbi:hypothetical protein [Streptomyces caeruleatus]|uniref:Uncharacterized protein n=1 Tax=Streptomyces caeruleatus TaxID=661399 RepID=A0A101U7B5_9ACTN|nr:hypothetical protein [Streptomyces caeruleatus]KUO05575.1 hypothetical protein AQJ67_05360 [Streptomyces caeruleatus]
MTEGLGDARVELRSLLSDPTVLVTAEPARVLDLLKHADDTWSRAIAAVYRSVVDLHREMPPDRRRLVLTLSAAWSGHLDVVAWLDGGDTTRPPGTD